MTDALQLGGNIELSGFREIDPASMVIIKKIVGNYARRMCDICEGFEKLSMIMKITHETESSRKFEVNGLVVDRGKTHSASDIDRNVFVVIDNVLKKIEAGIKK